jgi:zinc transporter ZupT
MAAAVPGSLQGLILFGAARCWPSVDSSCLHAARRQSQRGRGTFNVAWMLAIGIGLHNLAEGLVVGAAYASGAAALGAFLVIGFTLHNVTEGIGIAAPIAQDRLSASRFIGLTAIAGLPAILGTWIGGFAYSNVAATIFLGIGTGAIVQVIIEVGKLLLRHGQREPIGGDVANIIDFTAGLAIMYATALLVAV